MAKQLVQRDLMSLALGGAFFGSGGGGTIVSAQHLATQFVRGDYYPVDTVEVVSVEEASGPDAKGEAVMVAYLGAPEAINSALYPTGPELAVRNVRDRLASEGRKLAYIVPPESGALGFVVACLVAAKLGLAVIDADGAGRAVPSLPMLTYAASEIDPRPAFLVSQGGLCVELNVTPRSGNRGDAGHQQDVSVIVEQMMRPIVGDPEFGQFGGLAIWVMTPSQLGGATPIRGTLTRALELGAIVAAGDIRTPAQMIDYLAARCGLRARAVSEAGEFSTAAVDTSGGFDVGRICVTSGAHTYTVIYENESLLAWDSLAPQPILTAPDSLAWFVEGDGQRVFTNGDLVLEDGSLNPVVKGRRVTLLGWQAEPELRVAGGLILDSFLDELQKLGYLGPYVPLAMTHAPLEGGAQ